MSRAGAPGVRRSKEILESAGALSSSLRRTSQPPGSSSTSHIPSVGIQTRPGAISSGSRMRLCSGSESTAATQPSASTARAGLTDPREDGRRDGAQSVQCAVVLLTEVGFGQPGDDIDQRNRGGVHGGRRSRDVDDTDDLTGAWIPDGCAGAGPGVVTAHEVLGGEHLHGAVGHQSGTDGVGPDSTLTPVGALDESEPVGVVQHRW